MESLDVILHGFSVAFQPVNILYVFIGVFLGTIIGVLPGIGPATGVALLIPVTFGMDPISALIMLSGIYYGAMYGGSTTAILINTPGEASTVMTTLDGYQMAKNGRAGAALAIAAIGSFIAGTIGVIFLTFLAVPLSNFAVRFGPAEYFALMLFALSMVTSLTGKSMAKGMISTILGLMIATVGIDLQSGLPRFTLGITELQDGIDFLVVVVGLFSLGEVFKSMEDYQKGEMEPIRIKGKIWLTREEWKRSVKPIFRGGVLGFFTGVLPGAGGTVASILSYVTEKKFSKQPDQFGKGAIEGVAGPESANNASSTGAMVPMLTLGVPGSGTTAILMGALIMYGIQPGPLLFSNHPDLVWGVIDSMYLGNLMLLVLNLPLVGLFVRLLYIPAGVLFPLIISLSLVGVYSLNNSIVDLFLVLIFGVVGYLFRKLDIPTAPMVLSLVLGGMMEQSFRQAMTISDASISVFFSSPISVTLLILAFLSVTLPYIMPKFKQWKRSAATDMDI